MTPQTMNSGIRGGLWHAKHWALMGDAVWLFGYLVHRQTTQRHGEGLVLRGKPFTYATIIEETAEGDFRFTERTLMRWMARLVKLGYISVKHSCYQRRVIRILKAKKFNVKQISFPQVYAQGFPPKVADIGAKSGGIKEGIEIDHKEQKPRASRRMPHPGWREFKVKRIEGKIHQLSASLIGCGPSQREHIARTQQRIDALWREIEQTGGVTQESA